jgi:phage repressor protein C with HTH and peptisase S24 domain
MVSTELTFKSVRKELGLDQTAMAKRLRISRPWLSQIENDKRTPSPGLRSRLTELAQATRVSPAGKATEAHNHVRNIPVISWARAGLAASYEEIPKDWQETIPTDCSDENAFGLIIEGDSMAPNYQQGDIVILMPSQQPRTNGLVAVRIQDQEVVFKVLTIMKGNRPFRLTSYNHQIYHPRDLRQDEVTWIYPAYEVRRRLWR